MNKKNKIIREDITQYIAEHTSDLPNYMHKLERETHLNVLMPQMISGNDQGMLLKLLSQLLKPETILEIGTFTGYASICLAQGLNAQGHLYTIDINEELEDIIIKYIHKAGLSNKITFMKGNAINIIPTITKSFDLVFIDADKKNYPKYYQLILPKLTEGGIILVDNVLWKGKVVDSEKFNDKDTVAIREFNKMVQQDKSVENTILPIRDGMMLIRKLKS